MVEFYPAIKENEIMKSEGKWAEPEKHTRETQMPHVLSHVSFPAFNVCIYVCIWV